MKRFIAFALCLTFILGAMSAYALAEGEVQPEAAPEAGEAETGPDAAAPVMPAALTVDDGSDTIDAALCARVLRAGADSAEYESWLRTLAHVPHVYISQRVGRAILQYALGLGTQAPTDSALYLVTCTEAPLPGDGADSYVKQHFNLHGAIYSVEPLTSVTVSVRHRAITGGHYPYEATLRFDASENRTAYALDEKIVIDGKKVSLDSLMQFNKMKAGKHEITITATTQSQTEPVTLYEANFEVLNKKPVLTSNAFRDNYSTALRFFGGDTSKFLMPYTWRTAGKRDIYTDEAWRTANITRGARWRSHADAVNNFDAADGYLQSTYLRVNVNGTEGKVILLDKLVEKSATYVPRFQSELRLISHHTFGTAIDVNDNYGPNLNNTDNWALIGEEAADHLVYNGILTDDDGKQFYDFSYTGTYKAKAAGVPKSVINYLLYELAFFRAGFNWGYYYDHTCDAMHFSLTDGEYYRHMDSETGLRKVYEYYN